MKTKFVLIKTCLMFFAVSFFIQNYVFAEDKFPDGTKIPQWFKQSNIINIKSLGKQYCITDYGVIRDSTIVQTSKIQSVINKAANNGGGVIIIPQGTFLTGSLFFKKGTHLYIKKGGIIKGSDYISDFKIMDTRIEGQNLKYFAAVINAIDNDGFTMSGKGTVNGNGLNYWKAFWLRRKFNPECTNLAAMRPRLVFISHSNNIQLSGVHLINSPFWTTHIYKCNNVQLLDLQILAPRTPVPAPSSDALDIDVCKNVLVKNCYMSVNDDAIALKGGKGPVSNKNPNNGSNENIIIENCKYGFCHSALTCGSESIHDRNIILRNCTMEKVETLFRLKIRPDTPQNYEYITIENITGNVLNFIYIKSWTQFFDLQGNENKPYSYSSNIIMRNIDLDCNKFFSVEYKPELFKLYNFTFENLNINTNNDDFHPEYIENFKVKNVKINGQKIKL